LPAADLERLREQLAASGLVLRLDADRLTALRQLYEPYVAALAARIQVAVPPWLPAADAQDDWETTAWQWDPEVARTAIREPRDTGTVAGH
jgi:hypothetical protein